MKRIFFTIFLVFVITLLTQAQTYVLHWLHGGSTNKILIDRALLSDISHTA